MKNPIITAILFASACIGTGSALAQEGRVQADVPFAFTVGSKTLPAGVYTLSSVSDSWIIMIDGTSKHGRALVMSQPGNGRSDTANKLVFHKIGGQYFLSDLNATSSSLNLHFPVTKEEKTARARSVEAVLSTNDTVLVALN